MTNELLAGLIAQGGNDELLPLLWERMRCFYRACAEKYERTHADRCARYGVTAADILQESYFAMLDSVKYYASRKPEQAAMKFITFCGLPFKTHAGGLIGLRNNSVDALQSYTVSLDELVTGENGEKETPRGELVPDPESSMPFEEIERKAYNMAVRKSVMRQPLSEREKEVICYFYFNGFTLKKIGKLIGVSAEQIRHDRNSALSKLQKSAEMRDLFLCEPYRHVSVSEFMRYGSIVEQAAERMSGQEREKHLHSRAKKLKRS